MVKSGTFFNEFLSYFPLSENAYYTSLNSEKTPSTNIKHLVFF